MTVKGQKQKKNQRSAGDADVNLGKRIRLRRVEQGLSQENLGDALGVSFQQVQKYEKGVNRVSSTRLVQIAATLGAPVMFFYTGNSRTREFDGLLFDDANLGIRLLRSYSQIKNPALQKQMITLAEILSTETKAPKKEEA